MSLYLWRFIFLICVLIQTCEINTEEINQDGSLLAKLFRFGADWKLKASDEIDGVVGQFKSVLGSGSGSLFSNLRQIIEAASSGIQNSDTAVKSGLEAAKNAALTSYYAGRAAPKTAVDLTNVGMKSLENLMKNSLSPLGVSGKKVKQVVVLYEDGSVEPVSDVDNSLPLFAAGP
ncbi:uncharacterized protein LOC123262232 [Cotesia glomerata]|uniref:Uncharacterized protein n=1 Tax=Cotesia glomerata TaxID=32391 RepID=A0AAV7HWF3_COTGL|nr:uncharacterized protein LOC123262232 [Cotesia glomerata]KAH0549544.1 hypothetical protein KQX54_010245 [Cotesia glomerata]